MSTKNKFSKGKMIASIFGLTLLVAGVGAGTILVQQQQTVESLAYELEMPAGGIKEGGACNVCGNSKTYWTKVTVGGCNCRESLKCVKTSGCQGVYKSDHVCYTYIGTTKGCKADCGILKPGSTSTYYALKTNKCDGIPGIK